MATAIAAILFFGLFPRFLWLHFRLELGGVVGLELGGVVRLELGGVAGVSNVWCGLKGYMYKKCFL